MSALALALLMQYVVSVKAGLVNNVQGNANVAPMEMARQGRPIRTSTDGYVEVLLTPGSFLRIGENSEVVLDGVELDSVALRVVKGPAVIEVIELSKHTPIRVTTGNLATRITQPGIYRFVDGVATVLQGKLETADSKLAYEKGWELFYKDNYRARKVNKVSLTSLDVYSDTRSQEIARANYSLSSQLRSSSVDQDYWLYAPFIGMYTWIPRNNFRSPYGYQYYAIRQNYTVRNGTVASSNGSSGGGGTSSPTPTPTPTPSPSGEGGGGGGGGGAPAITVSTPSGQTSTPATYIESKSSPVGATQ